MDDLTDAELIAASIPHEEAFGRLYDRHATDVLRFFVRRVGPDVAEDLLAETFRVAFEVRARFDQTRASARPWLFGIGNNLLRHYRRSEERRLRAVAAAIDADPHPTARPADEDADADALLRVISENIVALPEREREVVLMYAFENLTYEELAMALNVPIGTVRSRLSRGREHLRNAISAREADGVAKGGRRDG